MYQLINAANALRAGKLTVGYIGGSITQARGTEEMPSWRIGTTRWLREQYPEAEVIEIDASISGTGSDFGVARFERDLSSKGTPDLLFVEFAVNDSPTQVHLRAMEGIVRKMLRLNPACDIVFIYTTHVNHKGKQPPTVFYHHQVAERYGIPEIDVGCEIWKKIAAGEGTWDTYVPDYAHPNGYGHALYIAKIVAFLKEALVCGERQPMTLPEPVDPATMDHAYMVTFADLKCLPMETEIIDFYGRGLRPFAHLTDDKPGLNVPFEGSTLWVFWRVTPSTGTLLYRIDGGEWQEAPTQDAKQKEFPTHIGGRQLADGLKPGTHTLEVAAAKLDTPNDGLFLYCMYCG